jgi:putative transposase
MSRLWQVKVTVPRGLEGRGKAISLKFEARRWLLVLLCDDLPAKLLEPAGKQVGVDVGIASFATTSEGQPIDGPRQGRERAADLSCAQKLLSRKKPGSADRRAVRKTVGGRPRKIADQRRDFHPKSARALVKDCELTCPDRLSIKKMVRRAKPRPEPEEPGSFLRDGQAPGAGLNKGIRDEGSARFGSILENKAREPGREVIEVDPLHTSQMGARCRHLGPGKRVSQAVLRGRSCADEAHAEVKSARNISRAGLARPDAPAA